MLLSSSLSTPENTTASVGDKFLPLPLLDYKKILDGFLQMHTACKAIKRAASYISSKASDVLDGRLLPLVVTNLHHHPEWTSSRCPNIFGPSFLNDNYGDKGTERAVRHVCQGDIHRARWAWRLLVVLLVLYFAIFLFCFRNRVEGF